MQCFKMYHRPPKSIFLLRMAGKWYDRMMFSLGSFLVTNNRVFRCVRQERISLRGSVRPSVSPSVSTSVSQSVRPSVTPVQKPRFSAVFGQGEIPYWNIWSTNMFWEPPLLVSRFAVCLSICHCKYVTWSIYAKTQSGRIIARSGL